MEHDVLPDLLAKVQAAFERSVGKSEVLREAVVALKGKSATYEDVNRYAVEVGEALAEVLGRLVTAESLPDGKMYYNIAERLLSAVLGRNHELISSYAAAVQTLLNQQARIGLKAQVPDFNRDRVNGLINRLASEDNFEAVSWILQEPIVNFSQSIVDDSIRVNAEFHAGAGLSPKIVRRSAGHCCDWCQAVVGTYSYPDVPDDVYRRHQRCRCTVDYLPKGSKSRVRQDVWSKKEKRLEEVEAWKMLHVVSVDERQKERYNRIMKYGGAVYGAWNAQNDPDEIHRKKHAEQYYESVRNRSTVREVMRIAKNTGFSEQDVQAIYDHVFENYYDLEGGSKRFDPDYDMAQSWDRLFSGKNIQKHDITLLHHELMESKLMADGMDYDTAHKITQQKYDYLSELIRWQIERGDL